MLSIKSIIIKQTLIPNSFPLILVYVGRSNIYMGKEKKKKEN